MRRTRRRVAVCLLALCWLGPTMPTPASAGLAGTAAPDVAAATVTWSAVMRTVPATDTTGALTVGFTSVSFVSLTNNGMVDLGSRYALRLPMTATGGSTGSLQECVGGTWNETLNTCSGTVATVATVGGTNSYSLGTALATTSSRRLRVNPNPLNMPNSTATLHVEVRRKLSTEA